MSNCINLLNGRQLVENGCKHDQFLPTKGPKSSVCSGSWLEQKQIESAIEDRKHALQHQRVEKIGSLSQATWIEDIQKALVTEKKGAYWLHVGHTMGQETYIYPEEIIHLLEMNALDIKYGGIRMSLQQAYSKFVGKLISLDEYRVYSNLSRLGYKLMRHKPSVAKYESPNNEEIVLKTSDVATTSKCSEISKSDAHRKKNIRQTTKKTKPPNTKGDCVDLNESSSDDCMMVMDTNESENFEDSSQTVKQDITLIETDSDDDSHGTDIVCLPSSSLKYKILSGIPNCYKKKYLSLKVPDSKYIPHNIVLHKFHYTLPCISTENIDQENTVANNRVISLNESLQFLRYNICANNNHFFNNIMGSLLLHNNAISNLQNIRLSIRPSVNHVNSYKFCRQPLTSGFSPIREITNQNAPKSNINTNTSKCNKAEKDTITPKIIKQTAVEKSDYLVVTGSDSIYKEALSEEGTQSTSSVVSKKQNILNKIQLLLSTFSSITLGNKSSEIKEALILAIIKFNDTFDDQYTLVFSENSCALKKMPGEEDNIEIKDSNVLELSSDSDSPPHKLLKKVESSTPISDKNKRIKKRIKRRKLSSRISCTLNSSDESCSSNEVVSMTDSTSKITRLSGKRNLTEQDTIRQWFVKDSWSKPEIGKLKKKDNYISGVGLKIASAILDNIKELSYKKDCPIESWSQGKQLYKNKITSNVVCISDDEMANEDSSNSEISSDELICIPPLLQREDCTSVEAIMKRLQIIESWHKYIDKPFTANLMFKISFDMYFPTTKTLRKSDHPPPPFSIIVLSDKSRLPTALELSEIKKSLHIDVSLLLAVVSFDTISYLQMENIVLPDMIRSSDY